MTVNSVASEGTSLMPGLGYPQLTTKNALWNTTLCLCLNHKTSHPTNGRVQARLLGRLADFAFQSILFVQTANRPKLSNGSQQALFTF